MAISDAHPMFPLILSLFFLPTLLAIPFEDCGPDESSFKVTGVETFQEENKASFNITGSTSKVITGGIVNLRVQLGLIKIMQRSYDLCELIACPASPGAVVVPFHRIFPWPAQVLKLNFYIDIEDHDDDEIVCLVFNFKTSSSAAISA